MEVSNRQPIQVVGYTPAEMGSISLPVAIARTGGIGVLDLEFSEPQHGLVTLRELLRSTRGRVGVRLGARAPHEFSALLDELSERQHWLVVSQTGAISLAERCEQLPASDHRELVLEVTDAAELHLDRTLPVTAIVARGNEAGGRVGEDSSLILLQKLLATTHLPIYVEGGIGVNAAAACYSTGAAGVVLGAQLLMMPESPLPQAWQDELSGLAGMEARQFGERLGFPVRVLTRPGYKVTASLLQLEEELLACGASPEQWLGRALPLVGWGAPGFSAWPVGQELGLAQRYRDLYKTTGRLVKAIFAAANEYPAICRDTPPLAEGAPLARSHGTRYPIVQGPMTRVSDCPEFADKVADAGALPFMALALMSGEQVHSMLLETHKLLGHKAWGVGLLGFVPQQLRDAQIKAVFEVKPPFALIAGGRPDQAAEFERNGIPAYIHVPAPELLKMFLEQGATRFVFEGRECGGHVGPLSSLILWETMIDVLLENVPRGQESKIHVLFAGGIHDARSAALVSVMAAQLVHRGFRIGVLMGSAYLFTEEIVSSGAVKQRYQDEAIACRATINLETGPGHASRCAVGPFSRHFYQERARARAAKKSADEVRDHLEGLNLGRLRLAAKGVTRLDDGELVEVDEEEQVNEGMYMLGQAATLRDSVVAVEDLHRDVSEGSAALLGLSPARAAAPKRAVRPSDIAIIGIGTLLPKAQGPNQYWLNIINKVNAITEVPRHRWDSRLYFDADRTAGDKIYSKWGGFLDEVAFDPLAYGIPPNALRSIEPLQLLALETARRALEDAGYADGDFDREHTSVILGAGGGAGDLGMQYAVRSELPMFVEAPLEKAFARLPEWTENSFPGLLLNVVAGRIANRFDLGGTNCIVDAACASSLAAFDIAVSELESGRSKVAIVGGVDTVQSPFGFMCFSKTQALSPRGEANTFDKRGDGIVISEGLAMVVLKPLADAERDGDRIYSVIKSIGSSSDGRALGLTAPLPAGQMRALRRAYEKAGVSPASLGLVEAHGTGTAVGDSAELETIIATLRSENARPKSIAIGSVKAQLGHTKATAGTAGLVKAVLALHHKVLPPHVGVENPLDPIAAVDSPVFLLDEARPWLTDGVTPRRAGVSAFGFGGTNFHVVLEEYSSEFRSKAQPLGASDWPVELLVFRAADAGALKAQLTRQIRNLDTGAQPRLADLAYTCAIAAERSGPGVQAAVVVHDLAGLADALVALMQVLDGGDPKSLPLHVRLHLGSSDDEAPTVAFLFPGQGAQYIGMLREPTLYLREPRVAIEYADAHLNGCFSSPLSQLIYPAQAFSDVDRAAQDRALTDTHVAQPAIVTTSLGYMDLLRRVGVVPRMAAGHSLGEYVALHAAGVMSRDALLDLAEIRGRAMGAANADGDAGSMAVVMATREEVTAYIADYPGLVLANHNAPTQCAISGVSADVTAVAEALTAKGVRVVKLPVAGAFHSRLMEAAQSPLTEAIKKVEFSPPLLPVYGNTTGNVYSNDPATICDQLQGHMLGSVQFLDQIENMYRDGASVFLEVGPKNTLTGLVNSVLGDRPHTAVATDLKDGGLRGILGALAQLVGCGVQLRVSALFEDRAVSRLPQSLQAPSLPATAWWVDGGGIRPQNDPVHRTGKEPALTLETREVSAAEQLASAPAARPTASYAAAAAVPETKANVPPVAPAVSKPTAPVPGAVSETAQAFIADAAAVQLQALDLYHTTMRQFLAVQEGVIQNFLGGNATQASSTLGPNIPAPAPAAVAQSAESYEDRPTQSSQVEAPTAPAAPAGAAADTVAAAPSANTSVPGLSRDDLSELVLRLTAERTGYPVEMLALEQDIEAELGIDSIKRVEIVGALTKELPASMQTTLQADVEALTRAKTLAAVIDGIAAHLPSQSSAQAGSPAPADVVSPAAVAMAPGLSRDDLSELVLRLTAERTGYPVEMLALEQDIEAELGIDSIKRVEIVGALTKELPDSMQATLQADVEALTRAKTLAAVIDGIAAHLPSQGSAQVDVATPTVSNIPAAVAEAPGLSRDDVSEMVLRLTAERTGYPVEMLALEQDIEAELGIDSIKRVEIVGALTKELPDSMQATLQADVEALTRAKTLAAVIDGIAAHLPSQGSAQVDVATPTVSNIPAAVAEAPGLSRDDVSEMVLRLTAERTGYPVEMLALEQDIEAELGIDSIKRVEIVGALTKELPDSMQATLQADVEALTRAKTLAAVIDGIAAHLPSQGSAQVDVATPTVSNIPAAVAEAPGLSRDDVSEMVLRLTAERTGYPVEMLALEQDIEAELGIDSIKRVEIVGALTKELPDSMQATLQADVEALTRAKTLAAVIDGIATHLPTQNARSATWAVPETPVAKPDDLTSLVTELPRFIMSSRVQPRPEPVPQVDKGVYLLSDDGEGLAAAVTKELERRGGEALVITQDILDDLLLLSDALDALRADKVPVLGVVHLACHADGESMQSLQAWRAAGNRHSKALFRLLKACASNFGSEQTFQVLSVSCQGGHFGRDGQITSPTAGGSVGLLKSAAAEWTQLQIKNLDLAPGAGFEADAETIVSELLCEPDAVEVGCSENTRRVFLPVPAPFAGSSPATNLAPTPDWVVLATGGARGITFSVLDALVPDGATVVLLARSPEPEPEPVALGEAADSAALRSLIISDAKARGEQPSIVAIESRVNAIIRDRSVRSNLSALRQRGIKIDYLQADVADEQQCNAAIDSVYERFERIDAVIHGAGIIEDKLIAGKSQESFDRVYDTKADSGYLLSQRLRPESLKWLMFFTSVAGRFGNRGQSDYAAGNEVLNRLAWYLHSRWANTRVIAVNWGPWDSGGMVSEAVRKQFAELGIMAISPQAGIAFARNELLRGLPTDVEVVAGQGPWAAAGLEPQVRAGTSGSRSGFNLVFADKSPGMEPTGAVSMTREFSLASDPYLDDHRLDGDLVVPAAVCAEWMAETTQLGWPDLVVAEVQDLRVLQGIQLEDSETASLQARGRVSSHADAAAVRVSTELKDTRSGRTAYRAAVLLRDRLPDPPEATLEPLPAGEPLSVMTAYRDYLFHGQRFQLVNAITTINEQGIDAEIRGSDALQWIDPLLNRKNAASPPAWLFDPGIVDVCLQMCLVWGRVHKGVSALPARFGTVRRYQLAAVPETLLLRLRIRPESTAIAVVFDAEISTPDGLVLMAMEDIETIGSERFNRLADNTDEMGRSILAKVGRAG
ncbi:SDR family NAD(P)-dependent oxidoreductase [Haliea sp. E1-2-M8]|uniref:type I polyketide synthase n=1 Tax=Haliea sp. E1-2-M8 TaxID=3064706 RepID=UPI00271AB7DD|nr:type I polyketide synthase [Haliea sp. E1-2-M8]MDO8861550.1 SDR family NAD(P)-dependent oxidoreductase [Haliea sp. E1-2-M8]